MNKEEYVAQRNILLGEAKACIDAGDVEGYKAKEQAVKDLDQTFEDIAKAKANVAALEQNGVVTNIAKKSTTVANPTVIDTTEGEKTDADRYRTAFAKYMMGTSLDAEETAVFNNMNPKFRNAAQTTEGNQVLLPQTMRDGIWKEIGEAHPILNDISMTDVAGQVKIIKETDPGTDAQWYDEDTPTGDSDVGFGSIILDGCELSKNITVSWKMKKMSIDAFLAYVTSKLAEKMGNALAKGIVHGPGKPGENDTFKAQPLGIVSALEAETNAPQIVDYAAGTEVTYKTMTGVMKLIKSGYLSGATFYAKNATIWDVLANIVNTQGNPMFVPDVSSGGVGRLFGITVKEEDGVNDNEILLANVARGYVMNANEDITLYQQDHVKERTTDYLSYAVVDGSVMTTKAFALLRKIVNTITPITAAFSKAVATDAVFTIASGTGVTVTSVKNGKTALKSSDYTYVNGTLTIGKAYLATLDNGAQTINVTLSDDDVVSATITVAA
jgi:HK97 family phage major capsid protein